MEPKTIAVQAREHTGKAKNAELRTSGYIPCVIYSNKADNYLASIDTKTVKKIIDDYAFMTRIFSFELNGKNFKVIPKDVQFDPISDSPMHFDFMEVTEGQRVKVSIPVSVKNRDKSVGIKRGGDIYLNRYNVMLDCPIESIPEEIMIDIANAQIGDKFYLSQLDLGENVKIVTDCLVAKLSGKRSKMAEAEPAVAAEGAAEAASEVKS